jgi:hypothetical protein
VAIFILASRNEETEMSADFLKNGLEAGSVEARLDADQEHSNFKFERADWTLFRTVEGLQQKAGVPIKLLRRLVLKELGDNALDTGAEIRFGQIEDSPDRFVVEDAGSGLDGAPEEIAELFSIRRPMRSTKLLRLPQRGALGNGLRVVAGTVLASEGSLTVITRNRRIVLQPRADGNTAVVQVMTIDHPVGTRIEIGFGQALPRDSEILEWIRRANALARGGNTYQGRSSTFWYDGAAFHELMLAAGAITAYEDENGEIEGMYREPRGSIYHPNRGDHIPLGTLMVEDYERPAWTFNKLLYVEKEGFSEAVKDDGWPERHDCALISSKGFTTRAARDLVDKLAEHNEPVTVFCVTDADAFGTMIYETFQEERKARGARKIEIVHLGLQPWEAIEAGLEVENVEAGDKRKPVANYILEREDLAPNGETWEEWLQTHRVELNAMTTPQFIAWLDRKMAEHGIGKLIPPEEVLAVDLEDRLEAKVRADVQERILREAGFERQVAKALAVIERPTNVALAEGIEELFARDPEREWRDHVESVANELSAKADRSKE